MEHDAAWHHRQLMELVARFETGLKSSQEAGMIFSSDEFRYCVSRPCVRVVDSDRLLVRGVCDGVPVTMILPAAGLVVELVPIDVAPGRPVFRIKRGTADGKK